MWLNATQRSGAALKGNVNWMRARQGRLESDLFGDDVRKLFPIVFPDQSDSACLDNAVEFLLLGGRSLPHAMMMLIPEPWVGNPHMDLDRRGFYEYHAAMMEPWDGPAAVCFTDGKLIGATLDRNGLRPCTVSTRNMRPGWGGADVGHQRHDQLLPNGIDRRVGHLCKQLLEILEQQLRAVRKDGQGGVGSHGGDRLFPSHDHGRDHHLQFFYRVAERLLALPDRGVIGLGHVERFGQLVQRHAILRHP